MGNGNVRDQIFYENLVLYNLHMYHISGDELMELKPKGNYLDMKV